MCQPIFKCSIENNDYKNKMCVANKRREAEIGDVDVSLISCEIKVFL